jgi:NAD+ kinase
MPDRLEQLGLVVHPRRHVEGALRMIGDWASTHGVGVGQVAIQGNPRVIADAVAVAECDLVLAVGGDGTTLAALHAAAPVFRPVMGVACGSIGVLTSVNADGVMSALDQVSSGDWTPRELPALRIETSGDERYAINDLAVVRNGTGQLITAIHVDGELYVHIAGDGVVVSTPLGSSAYTMAAGGPLLAAPALGMSVTPLAHHGGFAPPLVAGPDSRLDVVVERVYGGSRFELDGQEISEEVDRFAVSLRRGYASLVTLADQEPMLTGLRRRGLVVDAPRISARERRTGPD